jgi:hypothetical protein
MTASSIVRLPLAKGDFAAKTINKPAGSIQFALFGQLDKSVDHMADFGA